MRRKLPELDTPEWETEVSFYLKATKKERIQRAKELGFSSLGSYMSSMRQTGITLPPPNCSPPTENIASVQQPDPIPIPKIELREPPSQEPVSRTEDQVVIISDLQIGLRTSNYNSKIAKARMLRLYDRTCKFADIHRKYCAVPKLHVPILGDIPHGEMIGRQVMLDELEFGLYEQKHIACELLANFLINLCQWYEEIEVPCVTGNHGILGQFNSFAANWNIEIYDLLKSQLANYPQIKFSITADTFYMFHKIRKSIFLLTHGDKIPMYLNLPFYGIDRRVLRWQQSLGQFDYALLGHFHVEAYLPPSGIPVYMNGTLSSRSRYVLQRIGVEERTIFWTLFVGDKFGVTASHTIDLMRSD